MGEQLEVFTGANVSEQTDTIVFSSRSILFAFRSKLVGSLPGANFDRELNEIDEKLKQQNNVGDELIPPVALSNGKNLLRLVSY